MNSERVRGLLISTGAIIEGHFVGASGNHMSVYVAKDRATRFSSVASKLCAGIAEMFAGYDIDVVVAPAVGGVALSQWTAHHLTRVRSDRPEVLALYSEHKEVALYEYKESISMIGRPYLENPEPIKMGDKLILRRADFELKRGFDKDINGKRALVMEDVLTTGGSAAKTAEAIRSAGGFVVGLGAIANGGNVGALSCGVPMLKSLVDINRGVFTEEECLAFGPCAKGVPINTDFGHGKNS